MKKRIWTVLLSAALTVSALSGWETGGRAETKEEQESKSEERSSESEGRSSESEEKSPENEEEESGPFQEGLSGKSEPEEIWTCTKVTNYVNYGNDDVKMVEEHEYEYDDAGCLTKETSTTAYGEEGAYKRQYEYEYDDAGNLTKTVCELNGFVEWIEYEYDDAGNLTKLERYYPKQEPYYVDETLDELFEWEYDSSGTLKKKSEPYVNDISNDWIEYENDGAGNLTKGVVYHRQGEDDVIVFEWFEWEYDASGNLTKWAGYNSDGTVDYSYEYDSGNRWEVTWYALGDTVRSYYEYDSSGNVVKEIHYAGGDMLGSYRHSEIEAEYRYEYDSSGNLTKWEEYEMQSRPLEEEQLILSRWFEYEYEYDSSGNLKKKMVYSDGRRDNPDYCYEYEYEYDSSGTLTKMTLSLTNGKYVCEYDSFGNPTKCTHYNSDGSVIYWYEYEYKSIPINERSAQPFYKGDNEIEGNGGNGGFVYGEDGYVDEGVLTKVIGYNPDGSVGEWYQ